MSSGQNITGDAANEPSICRRSDQLATRWRSAGGSLTASPRISAQGGWAYTTNGGDTWTFPGVARKQRLPQRPRAELRSHRRILLSQPRHELLRRHLALARLAANHGRASDRRPAATSNGSRSTPRTSSGQGFQYQSWSTAGNNYGGRQFSRSTDGGFTWIDPIFIPNGPSWGTLDVDSNGNLFIGGVNFEHGPDLVRPLERTRRTAPSSRLLTSSTPVNLGGNLVASPEPINPVGLVGQIYGRSRPLRARARTTTSTCSRACDPFSGARAAMSCSSAALMAGRPSARRAGSTTTRRTQTNGIGSAQWRSRRMAASMSSGSIRATPRTTPIRSSSIPTARTAASRGRRTSPVSQPFNPFLGYPNQNKMGDYMQVVSDNSGGNVAYCATFNGEQDVYYVRVAPHVPTPSSVVSRKTHGSSGVFDINLAAHRQLRESNAASAAGRTSMRTRWSSPFRCRSPSVASMLRAPIVLRPRRTQSPAVS